MPWQTNVRTVTPYVAGEQPRQANIIKLNTNESPYPPGPAVARALAALSADDLRRYPDPDCDALTQTLADYHGLSPEQVFVGVGSDDVLALAFLTFFNGPEPILFPDISYSFYDVWANLYRIPFRTPALDEDFRIVKADYLSANGGIIFPNPNAPTGILEGLDLVEDIVRANDDSVVIIDEAYIDFGGESALPLIKQYDNLLVVRTFSKSRALAGLRIGYAMGQAGLIKYLKDAKFATNSYTMNTPSLALGVAAIKDEAYFKETRAKIIRTRAWFAKELGALGFSFPEPMANFIFATHEKIPAAYIFADLREMGIYVRHWQRPRIDNYLRITIGSDEEMRVLIDNLRSILESD